MPYSVECASIEVRTIVTTVTSTKVRSCSTFAKRHQRRQRAMLAGVGSKTNAETAGVACGSPVTGLTSRGTYCPMPKPLSRIQLLWQRFWPPPEPANATAPRTSANPRSSGTWPIPRRPPGSARHVSAEITSATPSATTTPTAATLTKINRSSAT